MHFDSGSVGVLRKASRRMFDKFALEFQARFDRQEMLSSGGFQTEGSEAEWQDVLSHAATDSLAGMTSPIHTFVPSISGLLLEA